MESSQIKSNLVIKKLLTLSLLALAAAVFYLLVSVNFHNPKLLHYAFKLRLPKLAAMTIVAIAIAMSSMVFQSIVHNKIISPSLLGMNSLYTLTHTSVYFFAGSASLFATNSSLAFMVDLVLMTSVATLLYSFIFKKTNHNILFILLIGSILSTFFSSMQSSMVRVMDPNEYDSLLSSLVASFHNINTNIIALSTVLLIALYFLLRKDLQVLDVISLGKNQAINLGVNYDRVTRRLLVGVTIAVAISTALVGPIAFLGLLVANLSREFLKTYQHKYLIPCASLFAMLFLFAGQAVLEHVFRNAVPLTVFLSIVGGMYFLYLLIKQGEKA